MCCSQICPIYFSSSSFCNILWQQAQDVRYYGKTPSCSSSSFTECFLRIDCSYVIASDEQQFLFKFIPHLHYFANFVSILIQSFPTQCQQLFSPSLCSSCSIPSITLIVLCIFSSDRYLFLERQRPKVLKVQVHQGLCTYKLLWSSVEPLTSQMVKKKKKNRSWAQYQISTLLTTLPYVNYLSANQCWCFFGVSCHIHDIWLLERTPRTVGYPSTNIRLSGIFHCSFLAPSYWWRTILTLRHPATNSSASWKINIKSLCMLSQNHQ